MKKKIIVLAVFVLAIGAGIFFWGKSQRKDTATLTLYGNVDIREVNLGFRVGGRVKEMVKDEGDSVEAGEVIARLDPDTFQQEMEQAAAQVASIQANLEKLIHGNRLEDIEQAKAALNQQEATLANAERLFNRQRDLLKTHVASQQEYDDAQAALKEAQARTKSAQASLALQFAGSRAEDIAQAQANLAQAEATLESAKIKLADTELKAPSRGVVTTRALEVGAIVSSGATALTVSLEDPVWARVYINETDLGNVYPGADVELSTDSRPGQPYHGKVGYISPRAEFTPKSVETADLRTSLVYRLRIVVSDADRALRQGMPVTVQVTKNSPTPRINEKL